MDLYTSLVDDGGVVLYGGQAWDPGGPSLR